jgi:hypothetical protein
LSLISHYYSQDPGFNGTLFKYMTDYAQQFGGGLYNRQAMMAFTAERYRQSLADNGQFFYGQVHVSLPNKS